MKTTFDAFEVNRRAAGDKDLRTSILQGLDEHGYVVTADQDALASQILMDRQEAAQ